MDKNNKFFSSKYSAFIRAEAKNGKQYVEQKESSAVNGKGKEHFTKYIIDNNKKLILEDKTNEIIDNDTSPMSDSFNNTLSDTSHTSHPGNLKNFMNEFGDSTSYTEKYSDKNNMSKLLNDVGYGSKFSLKPISPASSSSSVSIQSADFADLSATSPYTENIKRTPKKPANDSDEYSSTSIDPVEIRNYSDRKSKYSSESVGKLLDSQTSDINFSDNDAKYSATSASNRNVFSERKNKGKYENYNNKINVSNNADSIVNNIYIKKNRLPVDTYSETSKSSESIKSNVYSDTSDYIPSASYLDSYK